MKVTLIGIDLAKTIFQVCGVNQAGKAVFNRQLRRHKLITCLLQYPDATIAMELGCDGVLMNTAIACADNPVLMASAMKKAVESGREAFLAGRIPRKAYASASSPIDGYFF